MRRNNAKGRSRMFAVALSLGLLAACETAVEPQEVDVLQGLAAGIHPVVVMAGKTGSTADIQLHLRRIQVDAGIASYQGELTYDTGSLTLKGAELPQGIMGAWNETSPGKIRFAGAALEGVGNRPVLVMHFNTRGAVGADDFGVKIEEIVGSPDFRSLVAQLVVREKPLFSPTPLK